MLNKDVEHTRVRRLEGDDPSHQKGGLLAKRGIAGNTADPAALVQDRDIAPEAVGNTADDVGVGIPLNPLPSHHPTAVLVRVDLRLIVRSIGDMRAIHPNEQTPRIPDPTMTRAMLT
ncbi:unnamed protein product [Hydatigera taeniaeformis]|uniref:Uncharacterized protein n=1 Tax=Hydatigena taeniaeformis TaxID=6205 RepID=A0A0R3X631_HYDTA|nr:unnamed protein product [Hydatigera taeniaeformis]